MNGLLSIAVIGLWFSFIILMLNISMPLWLLCCLVGGSTFIVLPILDWLEVRA